MTLKTDSKPEKRIFLNPLFYLKNKPQQTSCSVVKWYGNPENWGQTPALECQLVTVTSDK